MEIINFEQSHLEMANALALSNYEEEKLKVTSLPELSHIPDLSEFVANGLGVAAMEGGKLLGFLGCYEPWEHAFDSNAIGTFSPIHAHGAVKEYREMIYKRMYQEAAQKWVKHKITYHAIGLYTHDKEAITAFFDYGFGHRCSDAVQRIDTFMSVPSLGITYEELKKEDVVQVRPLRKMLSDHMGISPCFMISSNEEFEHWLDRAEHRNSRIFVAKEDDKIIAYMEVKEEGENFITKAQDMLNICGALCLPEYRGKGIYQNLLAYVATTLKKEGYLRLGVDFESVNPTASGFWLKHFNAYTTSVTRRIDECALRGI